MITNCDELGNLRKNIISWYPIEEKSSVLQIGNNDQIYNELKNKTENVEILSIENLKGTSKKFDFVVLMCVFENINTEKEIINLLDFAKQCLNENGKILLAMQNKFGMKYWAGEKFDNNLNAYDSIVSSRPNILSMPKIKSILDNMKLKYKFYYLTQDYKTINTIYTDDFLPSKDSIASKFFTICEKNQILNFSEKEAFEQIITENKNLFPFFANSYFIEISGKEEFEDIQYVGFSIMRNDEYKIKTIIRKDYAYKMSDGEKANPHIKNIARNINVLNKLNINTLDQFENNIIKSKFLKDAQSFDKILVNIYINEGEEAFINKVREFEKNILNKLLIEKIENLSNTVFEKYEIELSDTLKSKLHFVKNGLYDLIFQNCLIENNKMYVYDQEWYEENVPIEFILYRALFNLSVLRNSININEIYDKFGLLEFVDAFSILEEKVEVKNDNIWNIYAESVREIGQTTEKLKNYQEKQILSQNHISNLEKNIELFDAQIKNYINSINNYQKELELSNNHIKNLENNISECKQKICDDEEKIKEFEIGIQGYRKGVEDLTVLIHQKDEELVNYANQLRTISNSISWKLTKPIRIASWMFNPFNGASFIDRIMPPGGRRRIEYDRKQTQKKYDRKVENYFKLADEETAEFWKGIDHRKALKREKDLEKQSLDELDNYEKWVMANTPTQQDLELQAKTRFKKRPKISIVIPLYNTDTDFFRELLYSVHCQTYSNWELCLADGSPEPLEEIKKMCEKDKRIKYNFLGKNGGISENTNEAIKMATGQFVALLDHDDMLSLDALYEVVKVINENKDVEFIYSDEDKIQTIDESRYMPHFKPDYAPDTLRANNYICHFSVIKKTLLDNVGYFNNEFDGAQDFDLILRITEKAKKIVHISKILYHWRVHKASTAMSAEAKPYAFVAGRNAVKAHLDRVGLKGNVKDGFTPGTYTVDYDVIGNPKVSILIPNKDGIDILKVCINSVLEKTTYDNYEIVIIENNSEDTATFEYYKELEKNSKIKVIYYKDKGFNYSRIINFGVKNTDGDFIVQLNNDTELITPDWLEKMIGFAQREDVGGVGVRLYYPDQTNQHVGIVVGALTVAAHVFRNVPKDNLCYFGRERLTQNMNAVTAACIMTKREIYEQVGYMNEEFAVAFNDVDFCLRIREKGKLIVYNPYVEFIHYESKTRGNDNDPDKIERFQREIKLFLDTWKDKLKKGDEYYNKNLSLESDQYEIRTDKVE